MEWSASKHTASASWHIAPKLGLLGCMYGGIVSLEFREASEGPSARGVVAQDVSVEADGAYYGLDVEVGTGLWTWFGTGCSWTG
jgi:hypothetical protein